MELDKFIRRLEKTVHEDVLVSLRYKYMHEDYCTYSNEVLKYSGDNDTFEWLNDWYEGQQFVEVLGYIPIRLIAVPKFVLQ